MDRTAILAMMGKLKLYGMRTAYDEIMAGAIKRSTPRARVVGDLLKAEIAEKQARSITYQLTLAKLPLAKDLDDFAFADTPVNETLVRDLASGAFLAEQRNAVLIGGTIPPVPRRRNGASRFDHDPCRSPPRPRSRPVGRSQKARDLAMQGRLVLLHGFHVVGPAVRDRVSAMSRLQAMASMVTSAPLKLPRQRGARAAPGWRCSRSTSPRRLPVRAPGARGSRRPRRNAAPFWPALRS